MLYTTHIAENQLKGQGCLIFKINFLQAIPKVNSNDMIAY